MPRYNYYRLFHHFLAKDYLKLVIAYRSTRRKCTETLYKEKKDLLQDSVHVLRLTILLLHQQRKTQNTLSIDIKINIGSMLIGYRCASKQYSPDIYWILIQYNMDAFGIFVNQMLFHILCPIICFYKDSVQALWKYTKTIKIISLNN